MSVKDFVRERILNFPSLVFFFINLAKKSLQVSLNEFCKKSNLKPVTKQALCKARKKLSSKTFVLLNQKLVEEFYSDNEYITWQGLRVIAIDGSDIQLPQQERIKIAFGMAINQNGPTLAMAKISYAYDVLNKITLDAQISTCKSSERDLAVRHIEALKKLNHDKTKDLYIFDRGYPSLGLLFYLANQRKDFLMRCSPSVCFGKIRQAFEAGEEDSIIRLWAKTPNNWHYEEIVKRVPSIDLKTAYVDVRMIVVVLNTGEKELLITSLIDQNSY